MKRLTFVALTALAIISYRAPVHAQEAPSLTATLSPTPATTPPQPTPIPLADVITQADAAEASLEEPLPAAGSTESSTVTRDLPAVTQANQCATRGDEAASEAWGASQTLGDLEVRWAKLGQQLGLWTRDLTNRADLIDKQIALLPDLQATWKKTREAAPASDTPPEIRQRIDNVLAEIAQTESVLQKRRAAILTEQSHVAEQSKRVAGALASIRAAQSAAVSGLLVRDSPPIWSSELQEKATHDLVEGSQSSFGAQFLQVRSYVARNGLQFIYLALIFGGLAAALFWVKRRAAKWTDEDPLLERANRVLQLPIATAAVPDLPRFPAALR